MNLKIGDKSKFSFAKDKTITDVKNVNFKYEIISGFGVCPHCGHSLNKKQIVKIEKLLIIGNNEYFVGYSDKGHTLKIDKKNIPEYYIKE